MGKKFIRAPPANGSVGAGKQPATGQAPPSSPAGSSHALQNAARQSAKNLVANASWTGKLPTALLQEYCQKQKWQRPDYNVAHKKENFIIISTALSKKNPKNNDVQSALLKPQRDEIEILERFSIATALEARNFAATWALHRVANHLSFSMQLPPLHKRLWQDLEELRKTTARSAVRYAQDPFAVPAAGKESEAADTHRGARSDNLRAKVKPSNGSGAGLFRNAIEVTLSKDTRWQVSGLLSTLIRRSHLLRRPLTPIDRDIIKSLTDLGFRPEHSAEVAGLTENMSDALELLMVFLPEDDLPARFLPPSHLHSVSVIAAGEHTLQFEYGAKMLASYGYDLEQCRAMVKVHLDVTRAWSVLQASLLNPGNVSDTAIDVRDSPTWQQECRTTKDIYGDAVHIKADLLTYTVHDWTLQACADPVGSYPQAMPLVGIQCKHKVPAYLRQSALRKLLQTCQQHLGEGLLFAIIDVANQHLSTWLAEIDALIPKAVVEQLPAEQRSTISRARTSRRKPHKASVPGLSTTPEMHTDGEFNEATAGRKALPAWQYRRAVLAAIAAGRVCVISGETGSGKSTQVGQYILDGLIAAGNGRLANIICTQPRRISAIALADRVATERSSVGEVAYSVRGDSTRTRDTRLEFVTIGILLRRLTTEGKDALAAVSHVIIDEVHERSIDSDFLLIILRDLLPHLPHLRVILMSATINASLFQGYFGDCAHVHIEGRTFPVTTTYIDDMVFLEQEKFRNGANVDLVFKIVEHIDTEHRGDLSGAVLIFMPGVAEIGACVTKLRRPGLHVLPLHASLSTQEQRLVFQKPPAGTRKVVVATNVAETSITIDDIVFVLDSGRVKQLGLSDGATTLTFKEVWCSQAASKQRRGRAGRVRAGQAFLCFSRSLEATKMPVETEPEILRTPLEQVCLAALAMDRSPEQFLRQAISPPSSQQLDVALELLRHMGALGADGLTNLGRMMALIPSDLRIAKFLVLAVVFDIVKPAIRLAACLSCKSPFLGRPDWTSTSYDLRDGDLFVIQQAYDGWEHAGRARRSYAQEHGLHDATLREIATTVAQYTDVVSSIGLRSANGKDLPDRTSAQVLRSLLASAFNPNVARIQKPDKVYAATMGGAIEKYPEARGNKFFTKDDGRVFLHPSSVLFHANVFPDADFVAFATKTLTFKLFLSSVTPCPTFGMLLLCNKLELDPQGRGLLVDGWVRIAAWPKIAVFINLLRGYIDELLDRKLNSNEEDEADEKVRTLMIDLIRGNGQQLEL